jgi:XTP/dITP diphosphohydrolase
MRLLVASTNAKKLAEIAAQLGPLGIELATPREVGGLPEVIEDQPTFAGNASKKARSAARATGLWALADDSGLEVDALGGEPGVRSARFGGVHGDDERNNDELLRRMAGVPDGRRGARFVCALAVALPDGSLALEREGSARGWIARAPRGSRDFGYDPLFVFDEPGWPLTGVGFAEMTPEEKATVSHRGRALRALASAWQGIVR